MTSPVDVRKQGRVAWVVLHRPEVHNALSTETNRRLVEVLNALNDDDEVGVVVLRGSGDHSFSAGADLREVASRAIEEIRKEFDSIVASIEAITYSRKPVIAAVQGYALGGGLGLVAACDMAIASERAVFGTPEITIGRFPLIISACILRNVPRKKMFELAFTGRRFTAREALEMGLVNRVVPLDDLWAEVEREAQHMASFSTSTLALGKEALQMASDMPFHQALRYLRDVLVINSQTVDATEGVTAFLERRAPNWRH